MKHLIYAFMATLFLAPLAQAEKVSGVEMPDTFNAAGTELVLNGAGKRTKFGLAKVYVGGLYLSEKNSDAEAIIKANEPQAIKLHVTSSLLTSEKMINATEEGFLKATKGQTEAIRPQIDEFIAAFQEKISDDDVFDIIYNPASGVEIYKNSEQKATISTGGMPFKEALFGIWLSEEPAQERLKKSMLGG